MRIIKLAFLSFLVFFGLILGMSLLIPSHIRISKAINISQKKDSIFFLIANRDQWPRWHPAFQVPNSDSLLKQNKISITQSVRTDSLITVNWQQQGKAPVRNSWQLHRVAAADSVTLQWYMDFQLPWYPWQKFSSLFYEKTYGTMMEQGLQQIKNNVEKEQ
ncbi:MAG TPA: hypothetical protein VM010_07270 [Chitinophagaceae bacterium]|nr:hypothetical protein [Chitinophagaceae bacterium]